MMESQFGYEYKVIKNPMAFSRPLLVIEIKDLKLTKYDCLQMLKAIKEHENDQN